MTIATAKRFTIEEYHRLVEIGFLSENDKVELICGEIIEMAAKGTAHTNCCRNLLEELLPRLIGRAKLQCQDPIVLGANSEPEPDCVILRKRDDNYQYALPNADDVLLVIEIASSTLKYDQEVKLPIYAEAGIFEYWIFNLVKNYLEIYSEPFQELSGNFHYRMKRIFLPSQAISLPCFPDLLLDLSKIFAEI